MRNQDAITVSRLREVLFISEAGAVSFIAMSGHARPGDPARLKMRKGRYWIRIDGHVMDMTRVAWAYHHGSWPRFLVWHVVAQPWNYSVGNIMKWKDFDAAERAKSAAVRAR